MILKLGQTVLINTTDGATYIGTVARRFALRNVRLRRVEHVTSDGRSTPLDAEVIVPLSRIETVQVG